VPLPDQHPTEDIDSAALEPIDSDVNPHPGGMSRRGRGDATVLVAIGAGGAVGASVRYLIGQAWPTPAGALPISTLAINVLGCALMGVLMVLIYLALTPIGALLAVWATATTTRRLVNWRIQ